MSTMCNVHFCVDAAVHKLQLSLSLGLCYC